MIGPWMIPLSPMAGGFLIQFDILKSMFAYHQPIAVPQCMLSDSFRVHVGAVCTVQILQNTRRRIADDACMVGTGEIAIDLNVVVRTTAQAQPSCINGVPGRCVVIYFN
jgi:hypothetical protein